MNIYLLAGYAGSGKSCAGALLQSMLPNSACLAFATQIKDDVAHVYNIPRHLFDTQEGKQSTVTVSHGTFTLRELLIEYSQHGKDVTNDDAIWAKGVVDEIRKTPTVMNWIIHDWRYTYEYTTLRDAFPQALIHRIRIHRPSVIPQHIPSEQSLENYPVDQTVWNTRDIKELTFELRRIIDVNHIQTLL